MTAEGLPNFSGTRKPSLIGKRPEEVAKAALGVIPKTLELREISEKARKAQNDAPRGMLANHKDVALNHGPSIRPEDAALLLKKKKPE